MPRRQDPSSTPTATAAGNKARVRFTFEPDRSSPNGMTYSWLIHRTYKGKTKAADAVRAFWLPFAYQDANNHSESELKDLAQQSIWRMEEQIQHLRETFGLKVPLRRTEPAEVTEIDPLAALTEETSRLNQTDLLDDFSDVL